MVPIVNLKYISNIQNMNIYCHIKLKSLHYWNNFLCLFIIHINVTTTLIKYCMAGIWHASPVHGNATGTIYSVTLTPMT